MLEARYQNKGAAHLRLAVSTQHYAFSVQAFVNVVEACDACDYEFILRESTTAEIIDDVRAFRSEVGILYTDSFNRRRPAKMPSTTPMWRTRPFSTPTFTCSSASTIRLRSATASRPTTWRPSHVTRSSRDHQLVLLFRRAPELSCRTRAISAFRTAARSLTC